MDQLIENGTVRRAKLGVTVQGVTRRHGVEPRAAVSAGRAGEQRRRGIARAPAPASSRAT